MNGTTGQRQWLGAGGYADVRPKQMPASLEGFLCPERKQQYAESPSPYGNQYWSKQLPELLWMQLHINAVSISVVGKTD